MAINFVNSAGNQYLSIPDAAGLTFPNGDWVVLLAAKPAATTTVGVDQPRYMVSTGSFGGSGTFNLWYRFDDITATIHTVPGIVASAWTTSTWRFIVVQRSGTTLSIRECPILSTEPTDGSSVTTTTSGTALSSALDGTAFNIGRRIDGDATRYFDGDLSRIGILHSQTLTDLEVAQLAYGKHVTTDLGKTAVLYVKASDNTDYTDSTGNFTVTKNGTPSTGTEPAWGYTGASTQTLTPSLFSNTNTFYAPVVSGGAVNLTPSLFTNTNTFYSPTVALSSSITLTDQTNHKIFQRISGSKDIVFSGTNTGVTPNHIQVQLYAADGTTVLQAWTTLTSATITSTTFTGTLSVPEGGMYRFAVRSRNISNTVLATSSTSSNLWGVGALIALIGSSGSTKWGDASSGTGLTANTNVRRYNYSDVWAAAGTDGGIILVANAYNTAIGVPVGIVEAGLSGSVLSDWSNNASSVYTEFASDLSNVGGKLEMVLAHVGTNDAANGTVSSKASHASMLATLFSNIRTDAGQSTLPIFISGSNSRSSLNDTQYNWIRQAEMEVEGSIANTYFGATTIDCEQAADLIHLTANSEGYPLALSRMQLSILDILGSGTYHRGPYISSVVVTGSNTATANVTHRAGTSLTVNSAHGLLATDGSGSLSISSVTAATGSTLAIVFGRSISGALVLSYGYGAWPISNGQGIHDNTTEALPMEIIIEQPASVNLSASRFDNANTFYAATVNTAYTLTANRLDNSNTFYAPSISVGAVNLSPSLFTNSNTFYAATASQGSAPQTLTAGLYTNTNEFYAATVNASVSLQPSLYSNTNTFYAHTVDASYTIAPSLFNNSNQFFTASVTVGAVNISPALFTNNNTFYNHIVSVDGGPATLLPDLFTNSNIFYTHSISASYTLTPSIYNNSNTFYSPTVTSNYLLTASRFDNTNQFFSATVIADQLLVAGLFSNTNVFYSATVNSISLNPVFSRRISSNKLTSSAKRGANLSTSRR